MIKYNLKKIDDYHNTSYDKYELKLSNNKTCYFYEKYNNQFVNIVEVIFNNKSIINNYQNNKIYIYFDNNFNSNDIKEFLEALNTEFNNLKFNFIINNQEELTKVQTIAKKLNLNFNIINSIDYFTPPKEVVISNSNQYQDYTIKDNIYIKDQKEENDIKEPKKLTEYANYNGYNERLIDDNVKNIVFVKNNKNNNSN